MFATAQYYHEPPIYVGETYTCEKTCHMTPKQTPTLAQLATYLPISTPPRKETQADLNPQSPCTNAAVVHNVHKKANVPVPKATVGYPLPKTLLPYAKNP